MILVLSATSDILSTQLYCLFSTSEKIVNCCFGHEKTLDASVSQTEIPGIYDSMDPVLEEFKRVLKKKGKLVIVNMTLGENFGSKIYDFLYRLSPKMMGGCRGIRLSKKLQDHGFDVKLREYYQQLLFPSEVILAKK